MNQIEYELVATGSIEEYRVVDGPEVRAAGKQPTSPWSYPARGFAAWGWQQNTQVVLPYVPAIYKFAEGIKTIWQELGVTKPDKLLQPIWVEDPLLGQRDALDHVILADLDDFAAQLYPESLRFRVIPHAHTPELSRWVSLLNNFGWRMDVIMPPKPYDYPNIFDRSGFPGFAAKYNLPVPHSVIATGQEQMLQAYQQVVEVSGMKLVWAKLAATGGGYGVVPVGSEQETRQLYKRFKSLGILTLYDREIPWEMQANVSNIVDKYSWQYHGNQIITPGDYCLQYMDPEDPTSWIGNGYNLPPQILQTGAVKEAIGKIQTKTMTALKEELGSNHTHMGGFDFTVTMEEGHLDVVILEHNGARMSDALMQSETAKAFGIGSKGEPFIAIKLGKPHCDISELWAYLKKSGLSYVPGNHQGMIPFAWLHNDVAGYATAILTAPDAKQLTRLYDLSINAVKAEGVI